MKNRISVTMVEFDHGDAGSTRDDLKAGQDENAVALEEDVCASGSYDDGPNRC